MLERGGYWLLSAEGLVLYVENPLTEPAKIFFFTCQQGADQADETASAQGTHTCDNFSQSHAGAAQRRGRQP